MILYFNRYCQILFDINFKAIRLNLEYYMSICHPAPFRKSTYRWYSASAFIFPSSLELTEIVLLNPGNLGFTKYPRSG